MEPGLALHRRILLLFFLTGVLAGCAAALTRSRPQAHHAPTPYRWRGLSLDVARHFFGPATLRRFIGVAAHERFNVVHLHLTDNEAWRLPSRNYPLLPSPQHYSESELRELVAYAQRRGVMLVPEIDVPAHTAAAIRSYPRLACGSDDTLCPAQATDFAQRVVDETAALFPAAYIHTGGDEVQGWTFQERQAFERVLDATIRHEQKTMIVWDDESEAAPSDAIVEVWHLGDAQERARLLGHKVIAAFDGPFYFDAVQGAAAQEPTASPYMSTLEEVYTSSPPASVLGVEGVIWSEHIAGTQRLWYTLLPRAIALGVVANGSARHEPWSLFRDRILPGELQYFEQRGYTYRIPNTLISAGDPAARYQSIAGDPNGAILYTRNARVSIALRSLVPNAQILYRTRDSAEWRRYTAPFVVSAANDASVEAKTLLPDRRAGAASLLLVRRSPRPNGSLQFDDIVSP
jgi:hexosaminidase